MNEHITRWRETSNLSPAGWLASGLLTQIVDLERKRYFLIQIAKRSNGEADDKVGELYHVVGVHV